MVAEQTLLLGTNGDAGYWRSALEVLLYPANCSFYRPFSYRPSWITPQLLAEFDRADDHLLTLGLGYVGIRFSEDEPAGVRRHFLPLREIHGVVARLAGECQILFTLGNYVDLDDQGGLRAWELAPEAVDANDKNRLFGRARDLLMAPLPEEPPLSHGPPGGLWGRLIDDPNVSTKTKRHFTGSTLLRLDNVRPAGTSTSLPTVELQTLKPSGFRQLGYRLEVGDVYEMDYEYRTLVPPGRNSFPYAFDFENVNAHDRLRLSLNRLVFNGNYRRNTLWVQPQQSEPRPLFVDWEPRAPNLPVPEHDEDRRIPLRIPTAIAGQGWFRHGLWQFLLGLVLILSAFGAYLWANNALTNGHADAAGLRITFGGLMAPAGFAVLGFWYLDRRRLR